MQTVERGEDVSGQLHEISEKAVELAETVEEMDEAYGKTSGKNFARILAENGYEEDTLITDSEGYRKITTEKRMKILKTLAEKDTGSVQELAGELERDRGNISRDLDVLFQEDVIEFERKNGKKKPVLKHSKIVAEPIKLGE
ncbi:MAG: hypothetical protein ABEK04_05775 [Candidatus Nanohalobium sp.]